MLPYTSPRQSWLERVRILAALFAYCSDEANSLLSERAHSGYAEAPEDGGLSPDEFVGRFADISREDVLAFMQLLEALLGPLTTEERRLFYKVKDGKLSLRLSSGLGVAPPY